MARSITQGELRNNGGEVMGALDAGEHSLVTDVDVGIDQDPLPRG